MHKLTDGSLPSNMQAEYDTYSPKPREVSVEEFLESFLLSDLQVVDLYQTAEENDKTLVEQPLPTEFVGKYGQKATMLEENISTYDDSIEDALSEDTVIEFLMTERRKDIDNKNIVRAIRSRRSVIIAIINMADFEE